MTEKELEDKIDDVDEQIAALHSERADLISQLMTLRAKFVVGDVVKWRKYRGRVERITPGIAGNPQYVVTRFKKDGSDSLVTAYISDRWDKPELVDISE